MRRQQQRFTHSGGKITRPTKQSESALGWKSRKPVLLGILSGSTFKLWSPAQLVVNESQTGIPWRHLNHTKLWLCYKLPPGLGTKCTSDSRGPILSPRPFASENSSRKSQIGCSCLRMITVLSDLVRRKGFAWFWRNNDIAFWTIVNLNKQSKQWEKFVWFQGSENSICWLVCWRKMIIINLTSTITKKIWF